jgi:hypothetical protein
MEARKIWHRCDEVDQSCIGSKQYYESWEIICKGYTKTSGDLKMMTELEKQNRLSVNCGGVNISNTLPLEGM